MRCTLVTPERELFSDDVDYLSAPGALGEFGILPGHAPFITLLKAGIAHIEKESKTKRFALISGFCEILNDNVIILADEAYTEGEVNKEQSRKEWEEARMELSKLRPDDPKYDEIRKKLDRVKVLVDITEGR